MIHNYKKLYRIARGDGGTTITVDKPSGDAKPDLIRLVASKGRAITKNGIDFYTCKDEEIVGSIESTCAEWWEIPEETYNRILAEQESIPIEG